MAWTLTIQQVLPWDDNLRVRYIVQDSESELKFGPKDAFFPLATDLEEIRNQLVTRTKLLIARLELAKKVKEQIENKVFRADIDEKGNVALIDEVTGEKY